PRRIPDARSRSSAMEIETLLTVSNDDQRTKKITAAIPIEKTLFKYDGPSPILPPAYRSAAAIIAPESAMSAAVFFRSTASSRKLRPNQANSFVVSNRHTTAAPERNTTSPGLARISADPQKRRALVINTRHPSTHAP